MHVPASYLGLLINKLKPHRICMIRKVRCSQSHTLDEMGLAEPLLCDITYSTNATLTVPNRALFPILLLKLHLFIRDSSVLGKDYSALIILLRLLPRHCHNSCCKGWKNKGLHRLVWRYFCVMYKEHCKQI